MRWRDVFFPSPTYGDIDEADYGQLRRRCKVLLRELRAHPSGAEAAARIRSTLRAHPLVDDLRRAVRLGEEALVGDQ